MPRQLAANDIINRVAVEVGLLKDPNPVASTDESFVQLTELLNAAGQELVEVHPWQVLVNSHTITTTAVDSGTYDLPADFSYMIDQTGWDRTNTWPLGGPLSAQDWTWLEGRDLVSSTIHAAFRFTDNKIDLYPQPPAEGLNITFEYISRNWLALGGNQATLGDTISSGADVVILDPLVCIKFLRVKFLTAKGFDPTAAIAEFETIFKSRSGKDEGAAVLNAGRFNRGFPYLSPYRNTGDTNYGVG